MPRRFTWARRLLIVGAALLAAMLLTTQVLPRLRGGAAFAGTAFPDPSPAPSLDGLFTASGQPADIADYEGKVVLLYFGYLACPDVCPTTLATVSLAMEELGDEADRVQLLMVSVDPARDSPTEIDDYLAHFDEDFEGLHAEASALSAVTSRWGIFYELEKPDDNGFYNVTHTATLTGVDSSGNLRVLWPYGITADELVADIRQML